MQPYAIVDLHAVLRNRVSQRERCLSSLHGWQVKSLLADREAHGELRDVWISYHGSFTTDTGIEHETHHGSDPMAVSFLRCSSMLLGSVSGSEEAGQLHVRKL